MPVLAREWLRRMRGGAQAQLIGASDGHFYIVKFLENPQHRRILVNEWIAGVFLEHLEIARPVTRIIEIADAFLRDNPEISISLGSRRQPVSPGWHFGSRFPGHPLRQAVYDILPDSLLPKIVNRHHFLGVLPFDKWAGNSDSRQAVFFRSRIHDWQPGLVENPLQVGFLAQMIDHGYILNGPNWEFQDAPAFGLFFRPAVYREVRSLRDFDPWIARIENMPPEVFDRALREIPPTWLPGEDRSSLEDLLERLYKRRSRVGDLVAACTRASVNPFPNWQ